MCLTPTDRKALVAELEKFAIDYDAELSEQLPDTLIFCCLGDTKHQIAVLTLTGASAFNPGHYNGQILAGSYPNQHPTQPVNQNVRGFATEKFTGMAELIKDCIFTAQTGIGRRGGLATAEGPGQLLNSLLHY